MTVSVLIDQGEVQIPGVVKHAGLYGLQFTSVSGFGVSFLDPPLDVIRRLTSRHHWRFPDPRESASKIRIGPGPLLKRLMEVNKEFWLVISLILISVLANFVVASNEMVLSFYIVPTVFSAYFYGRRHATLTALASVLLVVLMVLFGGAFGLPTISGARWVNITVWGGTLIVIGYAMGTLYERVKARLQDLRQTYNGVLIILQPVLEAREMIEKAAGTEFDPSVVRAFSSVARRGGLEVPEIIV